MRFSSRLKGGVTQALVRSLFLDAGYAVAPLGVEEVVREVTTLSANDYLALDLPDPVRSLPDFLLANLVENPPTAWLLEVKYRSNWPAARDNLHSCLTEQVRTWSPLQLVLLLGEPVGGPDLETPSRYIRTTSLTLDDEARLLVDERVLWSQAVWSHFDRLQDEFTLLGDAWEDETITMAVEAAEALYELD